MNSPKEYDLLRATCEHAGKVLTHKFLLGELWTRSPMRNISESMCGSYDEKIEDDPEQPHYILTETGVGYRLRAPD